MRDIYEALNIGDIQVLQIVDADSDFAFPHEICYPGVSPEEWEPFRKLYPEGFSKTNYHFHFGGILVRSGDKNMIVDTGVGTDPHPSLYGWPTGSKPGRMIDSLRRAGVEPEDIDVVFMTHCHPDHTGWNIVKDEPTFPNARYVVHQRDYESFLEPDGPAAIWPYEWMDDFIVPLGSRHKLLQLFEDDIELIPNARAVQLPGHTPGHCGVMLELGDESALLIGDSMCSPMGCTNPNMVFAYDVEHSRANKTRHDIVTEATQRGMYLVSPHFPYSGYGRIHELEDGKGYWRPEEGGNVMSFDDEQA